MDDKQHAVSAVTIREQMAALKEKGEPLSAQARQQGTHPYDDPELAAILREFWQLDDELQALIDEGEHGQL